MTNEPSRALVATVLIATRDRAASLERTLGSLADQKIEGRGWELIVVDNGSRDETQRLLAAWGEALPLRVLDVPRPGKSHALNEGLVHAKGELIVFTDDDVQVAPTWLADLIEAARRCPEAAIFGGPIEPVFPEETPPWIAAPSFVLASEAFGRLPAQAEGIGETLPYGANMALRARLLDRHCFDGRVGPRGTRNYVQGSEYDLLLRLRSEGERAYHVPSATVRHFILPHQVEWSWLLGRAERIGRGSARIKRKRVPQTVFGWLPLWLRRVGAEWRALRARSLSEPDRFDRVQRAHYWRGYVAEARRLRSERSV